MVEQRSKIQHFNQAPAGPLRRGIFLSFQAAALGSLCLAAVALTHPEIALAQQPNDPNSQPPSAEAQKMAELARQSSQSARARIQAEQQGAQSKDGQPQLANRPPQKLSPASIFLDRQTNSVRSAEESEQLARDMAANSNRTVPNITEFRGHQLNQQSQEEYRKRVSDFMTKSSGIAEARRALPQQVLQHITSHDPKVSLPLPAKTELIARAEEQSKQRTAEFRELAKRHPAPTINPALLKPTPQIDPFAPCRGSKTTRIERNLRPGSKSSYQDRLFLAEKGAPVNAAELFGENVSVFGAFGTDNTAVLAARLGTLRCLPFRIRTTTTHTVFHEGEDALKQYSEDPFDPGKLAEGAISYWRRF